VPDDRSATSGKTCRTVDPCRRLRPESRWLCVGVAASDLGLTLRLGRITVARVRPWPGLLRPLESPARATPWLALALRFHPGVDGLAGFEWQNRLGESALRPPRPPTRGPFLQPRAGSAQRFAVARPTVASAALPDELRRSEELTSWLSLMLLLRCAQRLVEAQRVGDSVTGISLYLNSLLVAEDHLLGRRF